MGRIHSLDGLGYASGMANLTCPFQARVTAARPALVLPVQLTFSTQNVILSTTILNVSECRSSHTRSQHQSTLVLTSGCSGGLWLFQPPTVTIIGLDCSFSSCIHIHLDQSTQQPQSCLQEWAVSLPSLLAILALYSVANLLLDGTKPIHSAYQPCPDHPPPTHRSF
jgi:hypothetical protein